MTTTNEPTIPACPECGQRMGMEYGMGDRPAVSLWCKYGPCAADVVGSGESVQAAFADFENKWERQVGR